MPALGSRYPAQLSGGQQQRVALARAIAHPPRVLLMDEPFGALDQKLREAMQVELRRIQQALGITTIFVTHDQSEAMTLSDTIAVMSAGRIAQRGTPQDIYNRPDNRFVADFIGHINLLTVDVVGREGAWAIAQANGTRLLVPPTASGRVTLGLRPHQVTLGDSISGNGLCGRIASTSFVGNSNRTRVQVQDVEWVVESRPGQFPWRPGDRVTLSWSPNETIVFGD